MKHCLKLAGEMGYDLEPFGKSDQVLAPINVDIAASTQKLFEEIYLVAVDALAKIITKVGSRTDNLSLSGGCALNCPSNSRIFRESRFRNIFVEPGCDDSGLAVGAASWLYHNVLDQALPDQTAEARADPYLGVKTADDAATIKAALHDAGDKVHFTVCTDAAQSAAEDLAADKVIGWFEGRSEIGPRALGHRSILADPRQGANWERVISSRAVKSGGLSHPAVLESEAETWFQGLPRRSPYMLFTGTVRSHDLPAITHSDGSARVQTVDSSCGEFFRVIQHFFGKTGVPVVLNTSFNGPGEPIVETPEHALRFLIHSKTRRPLYWRHACHEKPVSGDGKPPPLNPVPGAAAAARTHGFERFRSRPLAQIAVPPSEAAPTPPEEPEERARLRALAYTAEIDVSRRALPGARGAPRAP